MLQAHGEERGLLSEAGGAISKLISRPVEVRVPAGYDRSFLDAYKPNHTYYLQTADRKRLLDWGKSDGPPPPAGTYAREILGRLLIYLSWNSSRLEGNTYSLLETQRLIELGRVAEGRDALEAVMILNHKAAIEFLVENVADTGLDARTILNLHAILSSDLLADPTASGRLRRLPVAISGSTFQPLVGPQVIEELFHILLNKAAAIDDPFEQAFFLLVQLPYLQPFDDVNKRVSRLAANLPLIAHDLAPISFSDVPANAYVSALLGVYELRRVELLRDVFLWSYQRSAQRYAVQRQSMGQPDPFRLRHRQSLQDLVSAVIQERLSRQPASHRVRAWALEMIGEADREAFIAMAETELIGVRESNFARYRVRPSEYYAWRQAWDADETT